MSCKRIYEAILIMIIIFILSLYVLCFLYSRKYNRDFVEVIPLFFGIIYLFLYLLCFFNILFYFDYVLFVILFICFVTIIKKHLINEFIKYLVQPKSLLFICLVIFGIFALKDRGISHWDEWNFWIFDVKEIYSYQGFAPKGFNLIEEYGDYPPGVQLLSAYFMHLFNSGYDEGFGFFAYYFIFVIYLLPLLKQKLKIQTFIFVFVWMLIGFSFLTPTIMESRRPDFILAVIYGYSLIEIVDNNRDKARVMSIAISLAIISLIKTIGIQWVIFSICFYYIIERKKEKKYKEILCVTLFVLCFYLSWVIFCDVNERTNYITNNLLNFFSNNSINDVNILAQREELSLIFVKAMFTRLNENLFGFGISYVVFIIAILVLLKIVLKKNYLSKEISCFILVTGILELLFLFFSVQVLFADEIHVYLNIDNMIIIFNRYGLPYLIGSYMLFLYYFLDNATININKSWIYVTIFSILVGSIGDVYCYYYEYKNWPNWIETDKRGHSDNTLKAIDWLNENYEDKLLVFVGDDYDTTYIGYQLLPKYCKFLHVSEYSDEIIRLYYDTYQIKNYVFLCDNNSIKKIEHNYLTNIIYNIDVLN